MVSKEFREWACSLSGCDGGNPDADVWLCGIEWGYAGSDSTKAYRYYQKELPDEIKAGAYTPSNEYDWQKHQEYPYGKSVAKLCAAYDGYPVSEYWKHVDSFSTSDLFKLNLYPISFRHIGGELWHEYELENTTGFKDKELYRIWCFFNRFPEFVKLARDKKPNLIIGTGVSYLLDFFACFAGNEGLASHIQVGRLEPQSLKNKGIRTYYHCRLSTGTTLAVIPFFSGSNGLNSDYLVGQMGKELRNIVNRNR